MSPRKGELIPFSRVAVRTNVRHLPSQRVLGQQLPGCVYLGQAPKDVWRPAEAGLGVARAQLRK